MVKKAYGIGIDVEVGEQGKQEIMTQLETCWNALGYPGTLENTESIRELAAGKTREMFHVRGTRFDIPEFEVGWYSDLAKCFSGKNPELTENVRVLDVYDLPRHKVTLSVQGNVP